jgi:hypothetical protein
MKVAPYPVVTPESDWKAQLRRGPILVTLVTLVTLLARDAGASIAPVFDTNFLRRANPNALILYTRYYNGC